MSVQGQDATELGPNYNTVDLDGVLTTVWHYKEDMAKPATSSVKVVGEVVAEPDEPPILLPTKETLVDPRGYA